MMRIFGDWFRRIRAIFLRARLDRDLEDELQMHLTMEAMKYANAGIPAEEANRRARIAFGGPSQIGEACREARGLRFAENAVRDWLYALRSFRRSPGFAFPL